MEEPEKEEHEMSFIGVMVIGILSIAAFLGTIYFLSHAQRWGL